MEFDDQMRRFFGTDDLGAVSPVGCAARRSKQMQADLIGTQSAGQDRVYPTTWQEGKMWDKPAGRERSPLPPVSH
ncbi:hypothetical protein [Novosphingobium sp. CCH12-A3]|uniref:hypothetical protein n=1 Tax=Novosphingobium sp. CCH12-A3 TaxID=1768752 RepID=UPI0009E80D63|nr:hypothetical protein [Novosphingobium sp. CCH12-A3]